MPFKFSPGHCDEDCGCEEGPVCVVNPDDPGGEHILPCDPCNIPCRNLTLTWTNVLFGGGSTLLTHVADNLWISDCVSQIVFSLACVGGSIVFTATAYTAGTCPDGATVACSNADGTMVLGGGSTCNPFVLSFTPASPGCSYLLVRGYTSFTVTQ